MKKTFVCLANSKKYSGRCIAGIELAATQKGYRPVYTANDLLQWIRPISAQGHGELAEESVEHITLLDVVEIDLLRHVPQGYQSENVLFDHESLKIVDKIQATTKTLDQFTLGNYRVLFGNRGKAVPIEKVNELDRSLACIRPTNVEIFTEETHAGKEQLRASFSFANGRYDLPVTDIDFVATYQRDPDLIKGCKHLYFTLSLGLAYEGWHYKLVAGVVYF